jgi:antitoxin (DNA-binding transcriptional repressor) of toxin-antitoxin stability system
VSGRLRTERRQPDDEAVRPGSYLRVAMSDPARLRVSNTELATVREAMRELGRLLDQLDAGQLEKVVLTQRNQMRAVLISIERYSELERVTQHEWPHRNGYQKKQI